MNAVQCVPSKLPTLFDIDIPMHPHIHGNSCSKCYLLSVYLVLWPPSVSSLEGSSHDQHRLDGSQPPVIVVLL